MRKEGSGESREAAAEGEGHHVDPLGTDAHAGGHAAVLHHRADQQAERGLGERGPREENDQHREADDEHAVPAEDDVVDGPVAGEKAGAFHLHVVGTEDEAEELLDDHRDAPGGEQRFEGALVEEADDAALQQQSDARRDQEASGNGDEEIHAPGGAREVHAGDVDLEAERRHVDAGREEVLDQVGGVGSDHHQLAVGHVDHPHQAEGDGEPHGRDQEDAPGGESAEQGAHRVDPRNVRADVLLCLVTGGDQADLTGSFGFAANGFDGPLGRDRAHVAECNHGGLANDRILGTQFEQGNGLGEGVHHLAVLLDGQDLLEERELGKILLKAGGFHRGEAFREIRRGERVAVGHRFHHLAQG